MPTYMLPVFLLNLVETSCCFTRGWNVQFLAQGPTFIQNKWSSSGGRLWVSHLRDIKNKTNKHRTEYSISRSYVRKEVRLWSLRERTNKSDETEDDCCYVFFPPKHDYGFRWLTDARYRSVRTLRGANWVGETGADVVRHQITSDLTAVGNQKLRNQTALPCWWHYRGRSIHPVPKSKHLDCIILELMHWKLDYCGDTYSILSP